MKKKFKNAEFNNRKRQIIFTYTDGKTVTSHYGQFGIKNTIARIWVDRETSGQSIGLEFADGKKDYIPFDQPLALARDPEYLLQNQIEIIIAHIKNALKVRSLSKRYLAEQLKTSDNQIQRLLDPEITNKNWSQLYKILALLDIEPKFSIRKAA